MRPLKSGYSGYRGRRTVNDTLKLVALILSVAVLVVFVGLVAGQKYLVFTDEGLRLDLPFGEEEEHKVLEPGDISVVVRPSSSADQKEPDDAVVEESAMAALLLSVDEIVNGTAAQRLEEANANAVILDMKNEEGRLGWQSSQSLAAQYGLNAQREEINQELRRWNEGQTHTIARITCFRDNAIPYQRNDMALRASYGNWRDELGLRWMNPDSAAARDYLTQLCVELAELGFDEILLDCWSFPVQGSLDTIVRSGSYEDGQFEAGVERFLSQVHTALERYDTALAVQTDRTVLTGQDHVSGQTGAVLERWAHRIWVPEDGQLPALEELAGSAGIQEAEKRLVHILSADSPWTEDDCAVLHLK